MNIRNATLIIIATALLCFILVSSVLDSVKLRHQVTSLNAQLVQLELKCRSNLQP
jgi:hypothetical protein